MSNKKFAVPCIDKQIRLRSGRRSLLLATFSTDGVVVNSSLDFNLVNELRRFFDTANEAEEVSMEISSGKEVISDEYPKPDRLTVLGAADLIESRARVQTCLDMMLAGSMPNWVGQDEVKQVKLDLVSIIKDYTEQIELKLRGNDEQDGNVRP